MSIAILLGLLAAFIVGLAKAGLKGSSILAVVLLALAFGSKASTGLMLILFIFGDVLAVGYYKRHVKWEYLFKFAPAIIIGILIAVYFGNSLDEASFKFWMAAIIVISVMFMFWRERYANRSFPNTWWFAGPVGIAAGFSTMIGNLAGGFSNLFFLSTGLSKNDIIGTSSWLFLFINLFKLPFHIWVWGTVTYASFTQDLYLMPAVIIGFIVGVKLVAKFNEKYYRIFLLVTTAIGASLILFN